MSVIAQIIFEWLKVILNIPIFLKLFSGFKDFRTSKQKSFVQLFPDNSPVTVAGICLSSCKFTVNKIASKSYNPENSHKMLHPHVLH